jgi:uncharacterized membrane protein (DUF4010 family)
MLIAAALSATAARLLAPIAAAGLMCAAGVGAVLLITAARRSPTPAGASGDAAGRGPLRLREALFVAGLLSAVTLVASLARQHFGTGGVMATAALAGLADAHAPTASAVALFASGQLLPSELLLCVLIAVSTNSATRVLTAFVAGGSHYGVRVSAGLVLGLSAAWAAAWVLR